MSMAQLLIVLVLSLAMVADAMVVDDAMVANAEPCGDVPTKYPFANWMAQVSSQSRTLNIDFQDETGSTAMHYNIPGTKSIVEKLLKRNVDIFIQD